MSKGVALFHPGAAGGDGSPNGCPLTDPRWKVGASKVVVTVSATATPHGSRAMLTHVASNPTIAVRGRAGRVTLLERPITNHLPGERQKAVTRKRTVSTGTAGDQHSGRMYDYRLPRRDANPPCGPRSSPRNGGWELTAPALEFPVALPRRSSRQANQLTSYRDGCSHGCGPTRADRADSRRRAHGYRRYRRPRRIPAACRCGRSAAGSKSPETHPAGRPTHR